MSSPFRGILGRLAISCGAAAILSGLALAWASGAIAGAGAGAGASFAASAIQNCLVGLLVAAVAAAVVRRRVTKPLARLSGALGAAAEGQAELSSDLAHASTDELGTVFRHYSSFMANLNDIIHSLKAMVDASTEIGENVEAATVKAATLSREVGGSIQKNKEMIASLDAEIEKSSVGVGGVKARFGEIAGLLMENQASSVSESTAAIEEMVASIDSISGVAAAKKRQSDGLLQLVESSSSDMQRSLEGIREVVKSAEGLIDIVRLIKDVAERVDLLAMNAAIEAAHAAQAGRGFAVVADEIRKLAETTDSQAKTISDSLKTMIAQMHDAERATEQTDASMRKVMGSIAEVADGMTEIAGGVGELSAGGAEILQAMQTLVEVTERVRGASEETNERMAGVDRAIGNIAGLSEESLKNAERMESLVTEIDDSFSGLLSQGKDNADKIAGIDRSISRFRTRKSSSTFVIGYNEVPPFCMAKEDGSPPGATNAYLVAVLAKMGIDRYEFKRIQALERIYELLDRNEIDAYTLATREYPPNPKLKYRVPAKPTMMPAPGLVMGKAARLDRIKAASELSGLRIVTKNGMPLTPTMLSAGVKAEFLGGSEPLVEGVRLVSQGRAEAVYSIIGAELLYMARGLGVQDSIKFVPLPDPLMELFTAFSLSAAERYLAAYDAAHARVEAETPFLRFLEPYLGKGATI